jgi:hypothetical protein
MSYSPTIVYMSDMDSLVLTRIWVRLSKTRMYYGFTCPNQGCITWVHLSESRMYYVGSLVRIKDVLWVHLSESRMYYGFTCPNKNVVWVHLSESRMYYGFTCPNQECIMGSLVRIKNVLWVHLSESRMYYGFTCPNQECNCMYIRFTWTNKILLFITAYTQQPQQPPPAPTFIVHSGHSLDPAIRSNVTSRTGSGVSPSSHRIALRTSRHYQG